MNQGHISSNAVVGEGAVYPDKIQDRLVESAYVHHDHGGREHGHDWDDWRKADRDLKFQGSKRQRGRSRTKFV